jgi:hypothetical protein
MKQNDAFNLNCFRTRTDDKKYISTEAMLILVVASLVAVGLMPVEAREPDGNHA